MFVTLSPSPWREIRAHTPSLTLNAVYFMIVCTQNVWFEFNARRLNSQRRKSLFNTQTHRFHVSIWCALSVFCVFTHNIRSVVFFFVCLFCFRFLRSVRRCKWRISWIVSVRLRANFRECDFGVGSRGWNCLRPRWLEITHSIWTDMEFNGNTATSDTWTVSVSFTPLLYICDTNFFSYVLQFIFDGFILGTKKKEPELKKKKRFMARWYFF